MLEELTMELDNEIRHILALHSEAVLAIITASNTKDRKDNRSVRDSKTEKAIREDVCVNKALVGAKEIVHRLANRLANNRMYEFAEGQPAAIE